MNTIVLRVVSVPIVVVVFGVLIGVTYAFILPAFFPGYRTMWIGIVGVSIATLIGGYIGYHVPTADKLLTRISACCVAAAFVAFSIIVLSWFILANTRGE
ncbi:MAG TPA: hypothetical protein VGF01_16960 [Terracidiphilus sp.]